MYKVGAHNQELALTDGKFLLVVIISYSLLGKPSIYQYTRRLKDAMLAEAIWFIRHIRFMYVLILFAVGSSWQRGSKAFRLIRLVWVGEVVSKLYQYQIYRGDSGKYCI